jgi:hypothetical protein
MKRGWIARASVELKDAAKTAARVSAARSRNIGSIVEREEDAWAKQERRGHERL